MSELELCARASTAEMQAMKPGKQVMLSGWVHKTNDLGKLLFLTLRDRDGFAQVVFPKTIKNFEKITSLPRESVICVKGKVQSGKSKNFKNELMAEEFEILSVADDSLPIEFADEKINTDLSKRLDYRWVDLRNPKRLLIFKITTELENAMREYFMKEGFIELHSPKFTGSPTESGSELFELEYFGRKAYLAQSPQFYKQMAMAAGFEKVFEIAPVFRANPSHTIRHDTEYTSLDVEMSWVNVEKIMEFEEKWIHFAFKKIKEKFGKQIKEVFGTEICVPKLPFPRITMSEAHKVVEKSTGNVIPENIDLDSEGEKILGKHIKEKFGHEFVFLTEFPQDVRPFYHMRPANGKKITCSFDLLYKGMEITTGAQREHRYDVLVKQAKEKGVNLKSIEFYLNFFKWGCPSHGGFALSPTRVVMQMLELGNVREATFAPRDPDRLFP